MKQRILALAVALLTVTAVGGERSSGGRVRPPKGAAFVFSGKVDPKADWPGFETEYGADLQSIENILSQELNSGKLVEFRKSVVELEKEGRAAHAPRKLFVACFSMENYAEEHRVYSAIEPKLKHKLPVVFIESCDWTALQSRYKYSDRI